MFFQLIGYLVFVFSGEMLFAIGAKSPRGNNHPLVCQIFGMAWFMSNKYSAQLKCRVHPLLPASWSKLTDT